MRHESRPSTRLFSLTLIALSLAACGPREHAGNNWGKPTLSLSLHRFDGRIALSWTASNSDSCTATGGWNGVKRPTGADTLPAPSAPSAYTLSCDGRKGTISRMVSAGDSLPKVTLGLTADYLTVPAGVRPKLAWTAAGATACTAGGAWTGAKPPQGRETVEPADSARTFILVCRGPEGAATETLNLRPRAPREGEAGLEFPSNGETHGDVRFLFAGSALNPMYPASYLWRVKPRRQSGYYTTFFWGPNGPFTGASYYGCHPYPDGNPKPASRDHKWELSIDGDDYVKDANGHVTQLGYDRWMLQALRAFDDGTAKVHEFYWDLPDTAKVIRVRLPRAYGTPAPENPALSFGDAPWAVGGERLSGVLRGIQIYARDLGPGALLAEAEKPLATTEGADGIWYLNLDPTPDDISDHSGKGHHPHWASASRPALWRGPDRP